MKDEFNMKNAWLIGDIHGELSPIEKFYTQHKDELWPYREDNVLIILGDFGANYFLNKRDEIFKTKIEKYPFKYFVIRGNHEERPSLLAKAYPKEWHKEVFFNNTVWVENKHPNILYALDEGGEYEINCKSVLVLPGAYSVDKWFRLQNGWSWFPEEQMSSGEKLQILASLKRDYDYILSHTCPLSWQSYISDLFLSTVNQDEVDNSMEKFLDTVAITTKWKRWYWGHYHDNRDVSAVNGTMLFHGALPFGYSYSEYLAFCLTLYKNMI